MSKATSLLAAVLAMSLPSTAFADAASDARRHFDAIASGDVNTVMQDYGTGAQFQWVGGMLDGLYASDDTIRALWTRFSTAQGKLAVTIPDLQESTNPKGSTVVAKVVFEGKATLKVRYVIVYRDGKIVSEVWQVDPKL